MRSYLSIGFWFTLSIAANACQKAFVTTTAGATSYRFFQIFKFVDITYSCQVHYKLNVFNKYSYCTSTLVPPFTELHV